MISTDIPASVHVTGEFTPYAAARDGAGFAAGYPERIVDHDAERREALDRYQHARGRR